MKTQDISQFRLPKGFRGKSPFIVQLWWIIQSIFFNCSPQFLFGWRRFLLRVFGAQIGNNVLIRPSVKITYPWKLKIGNHSWIGDDVVLYNLDEIIIGDNSVISQKSYLCTGSHDDQSMSFDILRKPIHIGNNVWIASDVFIAMGCSVGDYAVVGARSSVFRDIRSNTLNMGTPCKQVSTRMKQ